MGEQDGGFNGFWKGLQNYEAMRLISAANDVCASKKTDLRGLQPKTLVRLVEFAVNEFEWEVQFPWWLPFGGNLWRTLRAKAYKMYEEKCHAAKVGFAMMMMAV